MNDLTIVTSVNLTEPKEVPRTWRERLCSWHPWRKTKIIQVPSRTAMMMGNSLLMHPAMYEALKHEKLFKFDTSIGYEASVTKGVWKPVA